MRTITIEYLEGFVNAVLLRMRDQCSVSDLNEVDYLISEDKGNFSANNFKLSFSINHTSYTNGTEESNLNLRSNTIGFRKSILDKDFKNYFFEKMEQMQDEIEALIKQYNLVSI